MRSWRSCRWLGHFLCVVVAALAVAGPAGAADSFLTPLGAVAEAQRAHLIRVVAITMIAIVPVLVGVPLILWRYRRGRGRGAYRPGWDKSTPLEIVMWGVPAAIIGVLGFWLWHSTVRLDPYDALGPEPLEVQVIGLDWKWLILYPEHGIATVGEMAVPVGRPVSIRLTTDTVMQSFFISALAGQIYAMPGMATKLNLVADRPGTTEGENTQYNGEGFAGQKFTFRALPAADWQDWVAEVRGSSLALDEQTYARLARRSTLGEARLDLAPDQTDGPLRFGSAGPDLFERVLNRYHQGKPVPPELQPGAPGFMAEGSDG